MAAEPHLDPGVRGRIAALRTLRKGLGLVWSAAPHVVVGILVLRAVGALVPVSALWISKRLIDSVVAAAAGAPPPVAYVWMLLGAGFGCALVAHACSRSTDYLESRLADEFSRDVSLRVMRHAATLDLAWFENAEFHDRLERARAQATDRILMLSAVGSLFQRALSLVSMAAGVVYFQPWLFLLLVLCVAPTFVGESHFAVLGYRLAHRLTPLPPRARLPAARGREQRERQGSEDVRARPAHRAALPQRRGERDRREPELRPAAAASGARCWRRSRRSATTAATPTSCGRRSRAGSRSARSRSWRVPSPRRRASWPWCSRSSRASPSTRCSSPTSLLPRAAARDRIEARRAPGAAPDP